MRIGILGSGDVGKQLGKGLIKIGHEVKIGTRDTEKLKEWVREVGKSGSAGNFKDAAKFGEVIIIATLWAGTENAINLAEKNNFKGKIVIDVTNPLDFSGGMPPKYVGGVGNSAGEQVQKWLKDTKVVKAFNTIGNHIMCNPKRGEGDPDLFIAGNNEGKKFVEDIAKKFGWKNIIDLADITKSHLLESIAMTWIEYAFKNNSWNHAFKLLKE